MAAELKGDPSPNTSDAETDAMATLGKKRSVDDISSSGNLTLNQIVHSTANKKTKPESRHDMETMKPSEIVEAATAKAVAIGQPPNESAKANSKSDGDTESEAFDKLTFPERLMHLLQNESEPDALWWQKDGLSFGFEQKLFTEKVLNKLFPIRIKFESFIRKLNRWGFRRVPGQSLPSGGAAYKHPLFQKETPEMMKQMRFGQKVDLAPRLDHFQKLKAAGSASAKPASLTRQQSSDGEALAGKRQAAQDAQNLALLQNAMASNNKQAHQQGNPFSGAATSLGHHSFTTAGLHTNPDDLEALLRNRLFSGSAMSLATPVPSQLLQQSLLFNTGRRLSLQEDVSALASSMLLERDLRNSLALGSSTDLQRRLSLQIARHTEGANAGNSALEALLAQTRSQGAISTLQQSQQVDVPVQHINHAAAAPPTASEQQLSDQLSLLRYQQQYQTGGSSNADLLLLLEQERLRRQNSQNTS